MSDSAGAARVATFVAVPVALIVAVVSFWALGGFRADATGSGTRAATPHATSTAPVAMAAPSLDPTRAAACRSLIDGLPKALRDKPRRPVTAGAGQNVAYGDPAITVACGGPAVTLPATAEVYGLSGVCWYSQPGGDGTIWTTVDRDTPVRVTVPASYDSPGQWVIEFSAPVAAALPRAANVPAGC
jgi:hypothetical protein